MLSNGSEVETDSFPLLRRSPNFLGNFLSTIILHLDRVLNFIVPKNALELWVGLLGGIGCSFAASYSLWRPLHSGQQSYSDLVAGYIIWTDKFKDGDYRSVFTFLVLAAVFGVLSSLSVRGFTSLLQRASQKTISVAPGIKRSLKAGSSFDIIAAWALFIFAKWGVQGHAPIVEIAGICTALCVYGAFKIASALRHESSHLSGEWASDRAASCILFSLLIAVAVVATAAAIFIGSGGERLPNEVGITYDFLKYAVVAALFFATITLLIYPKALRVVQVANSALQVLAPLLLLVYSCTVLRDPSGTLILVEPNMWGKLLLFCGIAMLFVDAIQGFSQTIRRQITHRGWDTQVRVSTAVALTAFLFYSPQPYSVTIFDDFHLGETLIPWQQLSVFGQGLYSDFVSVQGLLGISFGAANGLFFDNTVATYPIAAFWVLVIANCITSVLLCFTLGTGWALLLSPITFTTLDRVLLVPIMFLVLASPLVTKTPLRWLLTFCVVATLHFLWIPSAGTAVILALSPFAVFCGVRTLNIDSLRALWRQNLRLRSLLIGVALLSLAILLGPYLLGALSFVAENGSTNTVAYGVAMDGHQMPLSFPRWFTSNFANIVAWEFVRFGGWLIGSLVLLAIAIRAVRLSTATTGKLLAELPSGEAKRLVSPLIFGIGGALFAWALIPYSTGRIDAMHLSRSGSIAMLTFGFFIPVTIALFHKRYGVWPISLGVLGVCLGVRFAYAPPTVAALLPRAASIVTIPNDAVRVDGPATGFPNLGVGYIAADKWDGIIRLQGALNKYLKPGETYFDLTNRSAYYFFLGRRVPSPYSADYLAANGKIQSRILDRLARENPPVVWVGPSIRFDDSPASIRSYRLLRWFIERGYRYESADGLQFLVRPDRLLQSKLEEKIAEVLPTISKSDLAKLPIAWGRNFERLSDRFESRATLSLTPPESGLLRRESDWYELRSGSPRFTFSIPSFGTSERPDYLLLQIGRRGPPNSKLKGELLWHGDQSTFIRGSGLQFDVKAGTLLIPLGSNLNWHRTENLKELRLEISGEMVGTKLKIERAELLRLVD